MRGATLITIVIFMCYSMEYVDLTTSKTRLCDDDDDDDCDDGSGGDGSEGEPRMFSCNSTAFNCQNGRCIDPSWLCDSDDDCGDGSDEDPSICKARGCSTTAFQCRNGRCIKRSWTCDLDDDCGDDSDEEQSICQTKECSTTEFKCQNGRCIDQRWRCDSDDDCGDGSDEEPGVCNASTTTSSTCSASEFHCQNGNCITKRHICNRKDDCKDGSDEGPVVCKAPTQRPQLVLSKTSYHVGDVLEATCTATRSRPAANMTWFFGDDPVASYDVADMTEGGAKSWEARSRTQTVKRKLTSQDGGKTITCLTTHTWMKHAMIKSSTIHLGTGTNVIMFAVLSVTIVVLLVVVFVCLFVMLRRSATPRGVQSAELSSGLKDVERYSTRPEASQHASSSHQPSELAVEATEVNEYDYIDMTQFQTRPENQAGATKKTSK